METMEMTNKMSRWDKMTFILKNNETLSVEVIF